MKWFVALGLGFFPFLFQLVHNPNPVSEALPKAEVLHLTPANVQA